jgi:hypothetical protein
MALLPSAVCYTMNPVETKKYWYKPNELQDSNILDLDIVWGLLLCLEIKHINDKQVTDHQAFHQYQFLLSLFLLVIQEGVTVLHAVPTINAHLIVT